MTGQIEEMLENTRLKEGQVTIFVAGSTAAVCCFEYEPGLIDDIKHLYHRMAPENIPYKHHETQGR